MDEKRSVDFSRGPNTVCFTCGGFRKVSEPRLYMIQATEDTRAGMTLGEWRDCPDCRAGGLLPGIRPPV
ncbi:hypothetical protein [Actinopolyspora halophila]|uniref:hypothetical protein n=1 Tax=Actinopolyspora halophila TaxID=1850 RepID=UPI00035F2A41|nr:hypothetical protein [Actinopolyspora halophila]